MRIIPLSLLAGAGSIMLAGSVAAATLPVHTMTLQLPDGSIEQIRYAGDTAPRVSLDPVAAPAPSEDVSPFIAFGPGSPFAMMEHISAAMDRDAQALFQAAATPPFAGPGGLMSVDASNLPPGAESYRFVSTATPGGVCTQSTEITSAGPGQKPRVVSHSSGDCGALTNGSGSGLLPTAQPAVPHGDIYSAKAETPARPPAGLLREASYRGF